MAVPPMSESAALGSGTRTSRPRQGRRDYPRRLWRNVGGECCYSPARGRRCRSRPRIARHCFRRGRTRPARRLFRRRWCLHVGEGKAVEGGNGAVAAGVGGAAGEGRSVSDRPLRGGAGGEIARAADVQICERLIDRRHSAAESVGIQKASGDISVAVSAIWLFRPEV